jgi:hypothetical protein
MPAYSFKERFVENVKRGRKRKTIRGKRKHQIKVGDKVYLYYAMRTKYCTKIGEGICTKREDILFLYTGVFVNQKLLSGKRLEAFAKSDGFKNFDDMWEFWINNNQLPFKGDVIYWKLIK